MSNIEMTTDTFTCHQEDDLAVINILEGAKILSTTVSGKDKILEALNKINASQKVKGVAVLYSDKYRGDAEYTKFLQYILEGKDYKTERRFATTYKAAIVQFMEGIRNFPKPIVGGMDGDIGPTTFAVNLAFDLRIVTDSAHFLLPDLKLGLPPSPPLAYYLVHNLGPQKATELMLSQSAFAAQDALDLGLVTKIVFRKDLKEACFNELHRLSSISGNALVETRRMLQPDIDKMRKFIDAGFDGAIRCMYKMKGLNRNKK